MVRPSMPVKNTTLSASGIINNPALPVIIGGFGRRCFIDAAFASITDRCGRGCFSILCGSRCLIADLPFGNVFVSEMTFIGGVAIFMPISGRCCILLLQKIRRQDIRQYRLQSTPIRDYRVVIVISPAESMPSLER